MSDLAGKVVVVTGATRGIGRATAQALAAMGAGVVVHGRDAGAVEEVCRQIAQSTGNSRLSGAVADFGSLEQVRRLAGELGSLERVDVLINNAGASSLRRRETADGLEWLFGVNHLAPFLLTNLLLEGLRASAPARIVVVSSGAHRRASMHFDDLNWKRRKYDARLAYSESKLANVLFTFELARRIADSGVTANCLHPGVVATHIFSTMGFMGKLFGLVAPMLLISPAEGAKTSVYLAASPEVADTSGAYFDKCAAVAPSPAARDMDAARRLWEVSEQLTGLA